MAFPEGSTLGHVVEVSKAPYKEGCAVGIVKKAEDRSTGEITDYMIRTTKGDIRIELAAFSVSSQRWSTDYTSYENVPVRWSDGKAVAFGPFSTDLKPRHRTRRFEQYDILYGAGGFDPANTHLIIVLHEHSSEYGAPEEGAFGKVVAGKKVLESLGKGDSILGVDEVVEWEKIGEYHCTTDLSTVLEDGWSVFTFMNITMDNESPEGAEHFFALTKDGTFKVDLGSSSFISDHSLHGEMCTYENFEPRSTGSVWVRTVGYGTGKMFISLDDRPASIMHSVVGYVDTGIELARIAENNQQLFISTSPEPIWLPGMDFSSAEKKLSDLGVELQRKGHVEDDSIIVKQEPATTLEVLAGGKVVAYGEPPSRLVRIELYDDLVPKTLDFFRHAIDLQFKPVGALPLIMKYENTFIFKAEKQAEKYKEIFPENIPQDMVRAGEIGVTNQAAKRMGMVGVKLDDETDFGPTGEKFSSTNIIGRIIDRDKLRAFEEGDVMYVIEKKEGEL